MTGTVSVKYNLSIGKWFKGISTPDNHLTHTRKKGNDVLTYMLDDLDVSATCFTCMINAADFVERCTVSFVRIMTEDIVI